MSPVPPISTTEALAPAGPVGLPQQQNFLLQSRARMDALVLKTIRSADRDAAAGLRDLSQTLAALPDWPQSVYFWTLCAAYFEVIALGLSAPDDSHKRLSSKILRVYMALARSELPPWDELILQLLDVCAQAAAKQQQQAPAMQALLLAHRGEQHSWPSAASEVRAVLGGLLQDDAQDRIRVVGTLHIDVDAYDHFVAEADENSRQMLLEISEWALEPQPQACVGTSRLARSLADDASRVGLSELAELATLLARLLQAVAQEGGAAEQNGELLVSAAEEIRRLLHQFAAGFIKSPQPALCAALQQRLALLGGQSLEKQWGVLRQALGGAMRQYTARPDNVSARAELGRIVDQLLALAGDLSQSVSAQDLLLAAQQLREHADESMLAPGAGPDLQGRLLRLQAAGDAFFTTA